MGNFKILIFFFICKKVWSLLDYYVDENIEADRISERMFRYLYGAIGSLDEIGGIIHLKEGSFHTIEDSIDIKCSLQIVTDATTKNQGDSAFFATITFIKGGFNILEGEKNIGFDKIIVNQKGLTFGKELFSFKSNNSFSFKNSVIERVDALDLISLITCVSVHILSFENLIINNIKNNIIANLFRLEGNSEVVQMSLIKVYSSSLENCVLSFISNAKTIKITGFYVESTYLSKALKILKPACLIEIDSLTLKGNILLNTAFIISDTNSDIIIFLKNILFFNNTKRSDSEPATLLIKFTNVQSNVTINNLKILGNTANKLSNLINLAYFSMNILITNCEMSNNYYIEEALKLYNVISVRLEMFTCSENNKNSNSGNACVVFSNVVQTYITKSQVISNFGSSITCGFIFEQSENFENELSPYKKHEAVVHISQAEFQANEVRAEGASLIYTGTSIFLNHDGNFFLEETNFNLNVHYYNKQQKNVYGSPCIDSVSESNSLFIRNSKFIENKATAGSNCITFTGMNLELSDSVFYLNDDYNVDSSTYKYKPFTFGGGLQVGADKTIIKNVNFTENSAVYAGSLGFYVKRDFYLQTLQIINVSFQKNTAYDKGGAFFLQNYNRLSWIKISISYCSFIGNKAQKEGGAAYNHGILEVDSEITIENSIFIRNQGTRGAVFFNAILNFASLVENCTFSYNLATSDTDGGSVFYNDDNHDFVFKDCLISHNRAKMRGGVGQLIKGRMTDYGSFFFNNSAGYVGGVFILHRSAEVYLNGTTIKNSYSSVSGGACFIMQSTVFHMVNTTIENGTSDRGGAISIMQEAVLRIEDSRFFRCVSSAGTIIYSVNTLVTIVIRSILVEQNTVMDSGLFLLLFSSIEITSASIMQNHGTVFNVKQVSANFSNINLEAHYCQNTNSDGCLIQGDAAVMSLSESKFSNVNMMDRSIGFSISASSIIIFASLFREISGERSPSFLKALGLENLTITDCSFVNFARKALYVERSYLFFSKNKVEIESSFNPENFLEEGFLYCKNCKSSIIENSSFSKIKSKFGGVIQIISSEKGTAPSPQKISFQFNRFEFNGAKDEGGALYVSNQNIFLYKNEFYSNTATIGGAVYLNCETEDKMCEWSIESCTFKNNSATNSGGGIFWSKSYPSEKENQYSDNKANHGPNIASTPTKIFVENKDSMEKLVSGQQQLKTLEFSVLDAHNQVCSALSKGQATIGFNNFEEKPEYLQSVVGNDFFKIEQGKIFISKAKFISMPGKKANLLLRTSIIDSFSHFVDTNQIQPGDQRNYSGLYYFTFEVEFRSCQRGEIYKQTDNICSPCEYGSYSIEPSIEKCFDCPDNALCTGRDILAMPNYWRESENATHLYECNVLKEACPGGEIENICNPGYWGPLCGTCTYNHTHKYFKNSFTACKKCEEGPGAFAIVFSLLIFMLLIFVVIMTIKASFNIERKQNRSMLTILNCILINYMQILSLLKNIDIDWPNVVESSTQVFDFTADIDRIIGVLECPLSEIGLKSDVSVHTVKVAAGTLFFVSLFILTFGFWFGYKAYKKQDVKNKIIISVIAIYLLTMQPIIKFYTKNFNCSEINGKSYLKSFPSMECYDEEHSKLIQRLVLPAFLVLVLIPPGLMLIYLFHNKQNLDSLEVKQRAFVIINPYKRAYFYWEYCILVKRISLIFTSIFLNSNPIASCLALLAIMFFSSLLQIKLQPFKNQAFNRLEIIQNMAIYITFSSALYFSYTESSARLVVYIFLLSGNGIFLSTWLRLYLKIYAQTKNITLKSVTKGISTLMNRLKTKRTNSGSPKARESQRHVK